MKSLMDVGPILPPQLLLLHSSDMAPSAVFFSFLLCRSCDCRLQRRQQETTIVPGQKFSIFLVSIFISVLACQHSLINPQKRNRMTTGIQDNNKKKPRNLITIFDVSFCLSIFQVVGYLPRPAAGARATVGPLHGV